mmetsp:Transcript_471/g.1434  ORF Transcript_471/g.1434 Transcript_471/m.1434 type:complete len:83 (-) Transcript_471:78-326(-)
MFEERCDRIVSGGQGLESGETGRRSEEHRQKDPSDPHIDIRPVRLLAALWSLLFVLRPFALSMRERNENSENKNAIVALFLR